VIVGSHLDSVAERRMARRLLGVMAALEALRMHAGAKPGTLIARRLGDEEARVSDGASSAVAQPEVKVDDVRELKDRQGTKPRGRARGKRRRARSMATRTAS